VAPWLAPSIDRENTTSVANPTFQTLRYSFSSLSILGSLVIIITFIILKQQRRHPHSLVFFMAISDLLYSILNVAQEALGEVYPNPSDTVEVIYFFVTIAVCYSSYPRNQHTRRDRAEFGLFLFLFVYYYYCRAGTFQWRR
jgi:hypothetical protein